MAHAATISRHTDDLVRSIVTSSNHSIPWDRLREATVKSLKSSSHVRTNQFDIRSTLSGLVEKFAVRDRDDLSEALQSRLDELPTESRWLPEILSLLLQLSDRPLENTKLANVEANAGSANEGSSLTWEAILAEEPFDDDGGLWDDVERGYHSSGDDATVDGALGSDRTTSTQTTSVAEDDVVAQAWSFVMPLDESALESVSLSQKQLSQDLEGGGISELLLVRETLLMLHGLPTSVYATNERTGSITLFPGLRLQTAVQSTLQDTMKHFVDLASSTNILRHWNRADQQICYIQSCQASIQHLLSRFGEELASIEQTYVREGEDVIVSILHVRATVEKSTKPLMRLADIVEHGAPDTQELPFALLDGLYDAACTAELSGDTHTFTALRTVFLSGLKTYLKPIARWVAFGSCNVDDTTSLVDDRVAGCELSHFWQEGYAMKTSTNGQPHTPRFMRASASRIFDLGKTQAFLKVLRASDESDQDDLDVTYPNIAALEINANGNGLLPYSELLEETLSSWLMATAGDSSPVLRRVLLDDHRLLETYSRLTATFCSTNGVAFQEFAEAVFWSLDHNPNKWNNDFLLTELASNTIGFSESRSDDTLTIRIGDTPSKNSLAVSSIQQLQRLVLETSFTNPIQNITRTRSPYTYSKAFTLLLQIYRAKSLLREQCRDLRLQEGVRGRTCAVALRLRFRLLSVLETLHSHITNTAHSLLDILVNNTRKAEDIDAMASIWLMHDKQLETSLLLGMKLQPLLQAVVAYLELCEQFAGVWRRLGASTAGTWDDEDDEDSVRIASDVRSSTSILTMQDEADRLLSFLVAGLRGVGRAGGNTALETFAERLEWVK